MAQFRKKPVVIEAVSVPHHEYADNPAQWPELPDWLQEAWGEKVRPVFLGEDYWYYEVDTLEGTVLAGPDHMLIRGVQGELYPCERSIFAATYDPVEPVPLDGAIHSWEKNGKCEVCGKVHA